MRRVVGIEIKFQIKLHQLPIKWKGRSLNNNNFLILNGPEYISLQWSALTTSQKTQKEQKGAKELIRKRWSKK